jgi:hypothetical protein
MLELKEGASGQDAERDIWTCCRGRNREMGEAM